MLQYAIRTSKSIESVGTRQMVSSSSRTSVSSALLGWRRQEGTAAVSVSRNQFQFQFQFQYLNSILRLRFAIGVYWAHPQSHIHKPVTSLNENYPQRGQPHGGVV